MKKVYKISSVDKIPKTTNLSKVEKLLKNKIVVRYLCLELAAFSIGTYLGYVSTPSNQPVMVANPDINTNDMTSFSKEFTREEVITKFCSELSEKGVDYADLLSYVLDNPKCSKVRGSGLTGNFDTDELAISLLKSEIFPKKEILYLGDSRTQGLLISGTTSSDKTVYGVGYGYKWLIGNGKFSTDKTNSPKGGIKGIEDIMEDGQKYDIVIWLGVNDLNGVDAQDYFEVYKNLAEGDWHQHDLFIVSVGPVDDARSKHVKNQNITIFNEELRFLIENSGILNMHYVDLGFNKDSIKRYDDAGVHYSKTDNINIQNIIEASIESIETERQEQIVSTFIEMVEKTRDVGKSAFQIELKLK